LDNKSRSKKRLTAPLASNRNAFLSEHPRRLSRLIATNCELGALHRNQKSRGYETKRAASHDAL
jgi:hypothetical protein